MDSTATEILKFNAVGMALLCVRNTCIEDVHSGVVADTATGDFSDVKVVTPYGKIPWQEVSRITNDEMRAFMKQVVDRLYTVLLRSDDLAFMERMMLYTKRAARNWDEPNNLTDWFTGKWT